MNVGPNSSSCTLSPGTSNTIVTGDLQIFVITVDRPALLRGSLRSLSGQTVKGMPIAVLDNGTNPETRRVCEEFASQNVLYHNSRTLNRPNQRLGNFLLAQLLADKKFVMLFHDDDQLHPDYIRCALKAINAHADVTLVTGNMTPAPAGEWNSTNERIEPRGLLLNQSSLACFRYTSGRLFFPLVIYRTDIFKSIDWLSTTACYGKWADTPSIIDCVRGGRAVVFSRSCGWYGCHPGQDSRDPQTLPPHTAWINIEKMFLSYLKDDPRTFEGLSFCMMNYRHLASGYKRRMRHTVDFRTYMEQAKTMTAITARSKRFRWISNHLVQRLFLGWAHQRFRKQEILLFK